MMIDLLLLGILLIFAGFIVVFISIFAATLRSRKDTEVKGGGVIMIGPVPIIFGSDAKWATIAIVLAIVLVIFGLLYYVI
jgi:uncharacterized protein (TIGR00304 family)